MMGDLLDFFADPWNTATTIATVALTVAGVPQAWRIWTKRSAADVSVFTWLLVWVGLLIFAAFAWVTELPLIIRIQYTLGSLVNTVIVAGIVRFRRRA